MLMVGGAATCACESPKAEPSIQRVQAPKPEIVRGPSNGAPVDLFVKAEIERAGPEKRDVVVYVGAKWCEPCVRFHDALVAGELDAELPGVRFLEFDFDTDQAALAAAGYQSKLLPLFVAPIDDGRGSTNAISGSIKGAAAVAEITPKLKALIARARAQRSTKVP